VDSSFAPSAARATGIGLTLLPCFYAHGGCGGKPAAPGQARFLSDLDGFASQSHGLVQLRRRDSVI